MSDADREWNLLDSDETSVKIWAPTATDPDNPEQENGASLSRPWRQAGDFGRPSRQRASV
jgi:hypothetical protein